VGEGELCRGGESGGGGEKLLGGRGALVGEGELCRGGESGGGGGEKLLGGIRRRRRKITGRN
jgi:hypothetical protein